MTVPWPVSAYRRFPEGPPWPPDWEQRPNLDNHQHDWLIVAVEARPSEWERVEFCAVCRAPRCEHRGCMDRLNHDGKHVLGGGLWEPLGEGD